MLTVSQRAAKYRLKEYLRGPLPDDSRKEILAALSKLQEKESAKPSWWRRAFGWFRKKP